MQKIHHFIKNYHIFSIFQYYKIITLLHRAQILVQNIMSCMKNILAKFYGNMFKVFYIMNFIEHKDKEKMDFPKIAFKVFFYIFQIHQD